MKKFSLGIEKREKNSGEKGIGSKTILFIDNFLSVSLRTKVRFYDVRTYGFAGVMWTWPVCWLTYMTVALTECKVIDLSRGMVIDTGSIIGFFDSLVNIIQDI